ncbi:oxidoreductase [Streptomyces sp. NPDC004549]|uniref:oxidoreductase n=1 Tax=Streptomyces sp. NPDC004549 TaxID=3154283 RepID=UPI0033BA3FFB
MKTWFITGAARGLGLEVARAALESGDRVVAAARRPESAAARLSGFGDRLLTVKLDVTDHAAVQAGVDAAVDRFGRIDVLVNNAGYGQLGTFEEVSASAMERQFATNVFGTMAVTRAVLPVMRAQRSGRVLTVSSIAGLMGFEGASAYTATKFALEGWSETLGLEVAQFGIKVTLVEPGFFRTDFLDPSSASYGDVEVPDYAAYSAEQKAGYDAANHQQTGDPVKYGQALVALAASDEPPVRFAAGPDSYEIVTNRAETLRVNAEKWRDLSVSTDFQG